MRRRQCLRTAHFLPDRPALASRNGVNGKSRRIAARGGLMRFTFALVAVFISALTRVDDKAASRLAPKGLDGLFDLFVTMNGHDDWLDLE
jgi:hypothetical protein